LVSSLSYPIVSRGAIISAPDGNSATIQSIHNASTTHDGDTIDIPSGTFSWTARVNITKNITIQGKTTITGAGTSACTANDQTIIQDNTPRTTQILPATLTPNSSVFRLTGLTFSPGVSTTNGSTDGAFTIISAGTSLGRLGKGKRKTMTPTALAARKRSARLPRAFTIKSAGTSPVFNARIDNCHFALLYQGKIIKPSGWVNGLVDHCYFEARGNAFPFNAEAGSYGGVAGDINGNGSWTDYPWYGTNKFFFIETNSFTRIGTRPNALIDAYKGSRFVIRHNYSHNCIPQGHGTEGGAPRGQRCEEIYDNEFNMTVTWSGGGIRSGGALVHDNRFTGLPVKTSGNVWSLINYRENAGRPYNTWGNADGTSIWDVNATEADGSHGDRGFYDLGGRRDVYGFDKELESQPMGTEPLQRQMHKPQCGGLFARFMV
jgi:hypothetical protein